MFSYVLALIAMLAFGPFASARWVPRAGLTALNHSGVDIGLSSELPTPAIARDQTKTLSTCTPSQSFELFLCDSTFPNSFCSFQHSGVSGKAAANDAAPDRVSQPAKGHWAEPSNYEDGSKTKFMRGEVALAVKQGRFVELRHPDFNADNEAISTSSYAIKFESEPIDMAVTGLHGCTSVVIVSRRGALAFHIWEIPSMRGRRFSIDPPIYEHQTEADNRFERDVLDGIHAGEGWNSPHKGGIDNMRNDESPDSSLEKFRNIFNDDANPKAIILTPVSYNKDSSDVFEYQARINQLTDEITQIFQGYALKLEVLGYRKATHKQLHDGATLADPSFASHMGKILVQYQAPHPAESSKNAKYRIWVEGEALEGDWATEWTPQ
ncbi:uncharacterized protein JN550_008007 [Neoarthrinium moseri]|uniref:uncharacterized protein n=1 Tax=Neoarthrinium moseri TaxID=1658444 RepID=UPI001FDC41FE|nr:uncharacterized protein JN550_008007 [Neoarthrinium moseri]KAI1866029.1 hypothetical protein JN550_008007 [Neoarthrinium moseri]